MQRLATSSDGGEGEDIMDEEGFVRDLVATLDHGSTSCSTLLDNAIKGGYLDDFAGEPGLKRINSHGTKRTPGEAETRKEDPVSACWKRLWGTKVGAAEMPVLLLRPPPPPPPERPPRPRR